MPRQIRRIALLAGAAWTVALGVHGAGLLGLFKPSPLLANDTLVAAGVLTLAAAADRRHRAADRELLDAVSMQAVPIDASYSLGFEQGKKLYYQRGWDDAVKHFASGETGGKVLKFPPSVHTSETSAATADETTVQLPSGLAALIPRRGKHQRPAPHPRRP